MEGHNREHHSQTWHLAPLCTAFWVVALVKLQV